MSPADFDRLQTLMASRVGFRLTRDRMKLAEHRLGPVARREGFDSADALLVSLWADPEGRLSWAVVEALLNPETWFRRDRESFDIFQRQLLPALGAARKGAPIRVWSAGCATGQEAWSLAMAAAETGTAAEILATDVAERALEKARKGAYTGFEIQRGLTARTMLRWFDQVEDTWVVKPALKDQVRFARANLLDPPADGARFDVIFCRHLLSEMEPARRGEVLDTLERRLVDDGCLFLGPEERTEADSLAFRAVAGRPGLFVKAPTHLRRAA